MRALAKVLVLGALGLLLLIPGAVLLATVGLPMAIVAAVVGLPALLVVMIVGLPILIVLGIVAAILGTVAAALWGFALFGIVVVKLAVVVLVPLLMLGWMVRRVARGRPEYLR